MSCPHIDSELRNGWYIGSRTPTGVRPFSQLIFEQAHDLHIIGFYVYS